MTTTYDHKKQNDLILSINKTLKHLLQIFSHSFVVSLDRRQPACGFRRALQNSLLISVLILLLLLSITMAYRYKSIARPEQSGRAKFGLLRVDLC